MICLDTRPDIPRGAKQDTFDIQDARLDGRSIKSYDLIGSEPFLTENVLN